MYRNDAVEDRAMAIGNTDYIAPRTVFVFSFFIFFRFCAVRWTELAISSAFERTLIYRIVTCITNSSAVADKLARRTTSRLTAKFKNSHVTITTPLLLVICHPVVRLDIAYSCTKFVQPFQ